LILILKTYQPWQSNVFTEQIFTPETLPAALLMVFVPFFLIGTKPVFKFIEMHNRKNPVKTG
jgi:hypothetical protein